MRLHRSMISAALTLTLAGALAPASAAEQPAGGRTLSDRFDRVMPEGIKPEPPVRIALSAGEPGPPGLQRMRLVVTPLVSAEGLRIVVRAEGRLALLEGDGERIVSARAGEPVRFELLLSETGIGEKQLIVTAGILMPDGLEQTAIAFWAADREPRSPLEDHPGSRLVRTPDGRTLLVIPSGKR